MTRDLSRRSFLGAGAVLCGAANHLCHTAAQAGETVPGFDDKKTAVDASLAWKPLSDRKIRMGLVGHGFCKFAVQFELQHHPNVEIVAVSDLFPDRCAEMARQARCSKTYPSLEEMLKDQRIEAIFLATDAPSHARHCIAALNRGKHVATAVPAIWGHIEDAERLIETVRKNRGLVYTMFETSAFRDNLYAMRKIYQAGGFGQLVYSEGEYNHYTDHPYPSHKEWRRNGCPMWYPTHATAYYVSTSGGSFTHVSCMGMPSIQKFRQPNAIGNTFGSEVALMRTSEGGMARMMVSSDTPGPYAEDGRVRGQLGAYYGSYQGTPAAKKIVDRLNLKKPALPPGVQAGGHGGSHGYLGNDFVECILTGRKPVVDVVAALNMTVPGYYAHLSANKGGETLKIPQYSL